MTLNIFTDGTIGDVDAVNENIAEVLKTQGLNHMRQLMDRNIPISLGNVEGLGEAYVNSTGRKNTVNTGETTATFDSNKYVGEGFGDQPYVIIEATDVTGNWNINNCNIVEFDTGKWVLYCPTGTNEVRRAQIYKTLFYGTDGTNPRASSTYITGITAIKTSIPRDVGKQAHYARISRSSSGSTNDIGHYTGTFDNTSTNDNCSVWGYANVTKSSDVGDTLARVQFPTGTTVTTISASGAGAQNLTQDHTGTDQESIETSNPASLQLYHEYLGNASSTRTARAIILCVGDISWAQSGVGVVTNTDFLSDESIPEFTLADDLSDVETIVVHDIPSGFFEDDVTKVFGISFIEDLDTGGQVDFKLTDGSTETDWFPMDNRALVNEITAMTPTKIIVRLIEVTDTTAIRAIWVRATP